MRAPSRLCQKVRLEQTLGCYALGVYLLCPWAGQGYKRPTYWPQHWQGVVKPLQLQVWFFSSWCFPDEPPLFRFLSLNFRKALLALTLLRNLLILVSLAKGISHPLCKIPSFCAFTVVGSLVSGGSWFGF